MPRTPTLAALGLAAVLAVPASGAVGTPGPFAGTLAQGETDVHHYDNNPGGGACIDLAVPYTVTLTYAPASDTLTLHAGATPVTGVNGRASTSFWAGYCTSFAIAVEGTSVASTAGYVVTVSSGSAVSDQ